MTVRSAALTCAWLLAAPGTVFAQPVAPAATAAETPVAAPSVMPSPVETPVSAPSTTSVPEPRDPPESRELAEELDGLRMEVERLRDLVEPEAPAGEPRRAGLSTRDLAVRAPGRLRLGGVATGAAAFDENDSPSQFVFPRAALFAFAPVGEGVSFAGELSIPGGGAEHVDADRSPPGRGDVFLQYAAADFVLVPERLVLRGGLVAVPLGRTNLQSDESTADLLVRPAQALYVIPTPWADMGAGFLGRGFVSGAAVEWQIYVLSGPSSGIDARTGFRRARQLPGEDRNEDKAIAARVCLVPVEPLELGLSAYSGAYSPDGRRRASLAALDMALEVGPILLEGEGVYARTDGGMGALGLPVPRAMFGGSVQLSWRFLPTAIGGALPDSLQEGALGATVRYSFANLDTEDRDVITEGSDPDAFSRRDRLSLGLSIRPVPRYVLRAEYEVRTEDGGQFLADNRAVLSATAAF